MFEVSIDNPEPLKTALRQVAFAGCMCYQPSVEEAEAMTPKLPVKSALFNTGHHTTFQHSDATVTFVLDKVPVSLFTFGLHYTHPHYNTSQRSGRYCTTMFDSSQTGWRKQYVRDYIRSFWQPEQSTDQAIAEVTDWVEAGIQLFNQQLPEVTERAKQAIRDERPYYQGDIDLQASRIAQEQLRNVISTIVPTGALYTVNLSTLFSMYLTAWNPQLVALLEDMLDQLVRNEPKFEGYVAQLNEWALQTQRPTELITNHLGDKPFLCNDPRFFTLDNENREHIVKQFKELELLNKSIPFNLTPFSPFAYKSRSSIKAQLEMSVATFGQYQRHRTIDRYDTFLTNQFYVPPLLRTDELKDLLNQHHNQYWVLNSKYGSRHMEAFALYGSMVSLKAEADVNAWYHSVKKRECLNAQEEIWNLEKSLVDDVFRNSDYKPGPPCISGKCHEGKRYCGRDLKQPVQRQLI